MGRKGKSAMKEIIQDRLNKMEDLTQRKLLKDMMSGIFNSLIDYQENLYKNIEDRVFHEVEDIEKKYDIYFSIAHRDKIDPVDGFLYPISKEDIKEPIYDTKEILHQLNHKENIKLCTIFMDCTYEKIKEIISNKSIYSGEILTDKRSYKIKIELMPCKRYIHEIEKLYPIFQKNSIPWKTINNPYGNKFLDVILVSCEEIPEEEEILKISFDLEEYEKYKKIDRLLLWNIEKISLQSSGFPVPAVDKVNFEHLLSLDKLGRENGYVIEDEEDIVRYIKRTQEELCIISPQEKAGAWKVLKIIQPKDEEKREYEIVSNKRTKSFMNQFSKKQFPILRTKGEINRIMNSFEIGKYFELVDIELKDEKNVEKKTYDMNAFIQDEIRLGKDKKAMVLKLKGKACKEERIYDFISFLVSEIQLYFPEYACEGVLI